MAGPVVTFTSVSAIVAMSEGERSVMASGSSTEQAATNALDVWTQPEQEISDESPTP